MLPVEVFDKLRDIKIDRHDRTLIYVVLALAWATIAAILAWGADSELFRIALNGCLWLIAALVFVFVAAEVAQRKPRAPKPPPAPAEPGAGP